MSRKVKKLVGQRSYNQGLIDHDLRALEGLDQKDITYHLLEQYISKIDVSLDIIETFDRQICEDLEDAELQDVLHSSRTYFMNISVRLAKFRLLRDTLAPKMTPDPTIKATASKAVKLPLPPIHLDTFKNNSDNPFAYYSFKKSFLNAIAGMPDLTNSQKLIYLKGYLSGEAFNLVENLPIEDTNFKLALQLLDKSFLDSQLIVDKTLNSILNTPDVSQLKDVEFFIRLIANKVQDLKGLGVNLVEPGSSGLLLLSKIVNLKLPRPFLIELSRETNTNYPNFNQLLDKYQEILVRLRLGYVEQGVKLKAKGDSVGPSSSPKWDYKNKTVSEDKSKDKNIAKARPSTEVNKKQSLRCKFCPSSEHSASKCPSYVSLEARKSRASTLGYCNRCLNSKHSPSECPGLKAALPYKCFVCGKSEHHVAFCPQDKTDKKVFNINTDYTISDIIVPLLSLPVIRDKRNSARCAFLLDSGAQFSIINKEFVEKRVGPCLSPPIYKLVSSFGLPVANRVGYNYVADLRLPCKSRIPCLFFAIEGFNLSVQIPEIGTVLQSMNDFNFPVSPDFPRVSGEDFEILGIIGNDILQHFEHFSLEKAPIFGSRSCKVIQLANGYLPYGTGLNYIPPCEKPRYIKRILGRNSENPVPENGVECHTTVAKTPKVTFVESKADSFDTVYSGETLVFHNSALNQDTSCPQPEIKLKKEVVDFTPPKKLGREKGLVNFAIEPVGHQFDPLQEIFVNSNVEYGLDNFYSLESIGIKEEDCPSYENVQVENFKKSISFQNEHYYVKLPWKADMVKQVPSNLKIALAVAQRVYEKLENQHIADKYEEVFDQQEELGIIEPVDKRVPGQVFIPHRPVIKTDDQTTTKIRPVFNCSLKVGKSPSLNEAAFPGIDLMNNLLSLLLYFRTNNFVVLADIMKAFLQIRLSDEEDKNRFCFFRKVNGKYVPYRYNTIIFGFVSSPFILNYVIQHHLNLNSHLNVANLLMGKLYVDNLIFTSNEFDNLPFIVHNMNRLMLAGGLPLREWACNYMTVLSCIKDEDICKAQEVKVLGYLYNKDYDTLRLKNASLDSSASTKRQILSSLASIFDPLGIFAPLLLQGKLIIRELCQKMVDWDDKLDRETLAKWEKLCKSFKEVSDASFSRRVFNSDMPVKLYVFADASKEAYGCAIYVVQNGRSSLLFSKVKVAPIKQRTLPTLELLAAQLSLKCLETILEGGLVPVSLIESIVSFVDSQVALTWILGNKAPKKNIFVNNRVREISSLLESFKIKFRPVSFTFVPSEYNQADFLTKVCDPKKFLEKFDWWVKGDDWLLAPPQEWPKGQLGCIPSAIKGELVNTVLAQAESAPVVDVNKYSNYSELLEYTVWIFKAVHRFRKSDADPVRAATNYLMGLMQRDAFPSELSYLKDPEGAEVPPLVKQLNLFLDDNGVIRTKGRIDKNVTLTYDVVNPILMSKQHHLTRILIYYAHCKVMHMGLQSTLSFLRMHGFWILKARQAVLNRLKDCIVCKRYNTRAVSYPAPSSLPASRVNLSVPFAHTGVDYTGHLWVRDRKGDKVKVYILIFTCFNTRAVHLEAVESMTTAEFILAFVRFVNRYGIPSVVYSDNARSFVQAGSIIEQLLSSSEFEEKFRTASIGHKTIPIYAAWYGAVWERLIKTVKHCLFKVLGRSVPTLPEFVTFLSDIQKILNNRPLTYRSRENEIDIITPNHFLVGRPIPSLMFGDFEQVPEWEYNEEEGYSSHLSQVLNLRDYLHEEFKERWLTEYLVNLREKDRASFGGNKTWEKGEIALLKLPTKSRPFWPLVRIVDTYPDFEMVMRTVKVAKPDGSLVKVNVQHLIPLELYCELNTPNTRDVSEEDSDIVRGVETHEEANSEVESGQDFVVAGAEGGMPVSEIGNVIPVTESSRPSRRTAQASRAQTISLASKGLL